MLYAVKSTMQNQLTIKTEEVLTIAYVAAA
jgi:hypothetical protein